jgi:hypothetical protein
VDALPTVFAHEDVLGTITGFLDVSSWAALLQTSNSLKSKLTSAELLVRAAGHSTSILLYAWSLASQPVSNSFLSFSFSFLPFLPFEDSNYPPS